MSQDENYTEIYTIELLLQKILNGDRGYDVSQIVAAYETANQAHAGQVRKSGEPYIVHPIAVAYILLDYGMDTETVCAGLLHDVVEDTNITLQDIKNKFPPVVAEIVDGVTKLGENSEGLTKDEKFAENVRKMVVAMNGDIRVVIVKLCDRLHNMRTLHFMNSDKQVEKSYETMAVYAAFAARLGINTLRRELQDLAIHYLDPVACKEIEDNMALLKNEQEKFMNNVKQQISDRLSLEKFKKVPGIDSRIKSTYSIYQKRFANISPRDEIYDKYAMRIIVSDTEECYRVLGIIHDMFTPIPGRFKDYAANPKQNGYRSIHTTVMGRDTIAFEVQIRSWSMHYIAEYGVAAHWKYKEGEKNDSEWESQLDWVRSMVESFSTSDDAEELITTIKNDLTRQSITVLTPKGMGVSLPNGSTPIDFAYCIHAEIGHSAIGAVVNSRDTPLDYALEDGQIVEIITSKVPSGPQRHWLSFVKTGPAKAKIRSWLKRNRRQENIAIGKAQLTDAFRKHWIKIPEEELPEFLEEYLKKYNCKDINDLYASIGYGGILLPRLMQHIKRKDANRHDFNVSGSDSGILIRPKLDFQYGGEITISDFDSKLKIKFAGCCNPLPGDDIIGFVTRAGQGITVHMLDCENYKEGLKRAETARRWIPLEWAQAHPTEDNGQILQRGLHIIAGDRVGLIHDITEVLLKFNIPIIHSQSKTDENKNAVFSAMLRMTSKDQWDIICNRLRKIQGILSVQRR
ncbi:MAG: bifunctional (p)ppGpp synthetase/guanosine-3',5'-bis(diphosphate) 3'-pyrophosphohydrolase [Oscillospiraceae bacterium]|jgi:GTP pyrophosphokinase|nr:bifunctional (p)ppGpp synthetase/guanosine-3',5'-bis(diphosphate) 3'-pyrophosphohydrolase [Oscillospiraceae bacterium]